MIIFKSHALGALKFPRYIILIFKIYFRNSEIKEPR